MQLFVVEITHMALMNMLTGSAAMAMNHSIQLSCRCATASRGLNTTFFLKFSKNKIFLKKQ